jgi:hypothetical protein
VLAAEADARHVDDHPAHGIRPPEPASSALDPARRHVMSGSQYGAVSPAILGLPGVSPYVLAFLAVRLARCATSTNPMRR